MVNYIIKRNGDKVIFQEDKIIKAIQKAYKEANKFADEELLINIAKKIKYDYSDETLTVEQVQDLVIKELMKIDSDVATRYVLYRYTKHPLGNSLNIPVETFKTKSIYNENGDDTVNSKSIIDANPTNLQIFNNKKYKFTDEIYKIMMNNFWKPEEISLVDDIKLYRALKIEEKEAFDKILSFLIFLDSIQTNNLVNINNYITASEINLCLSIQAYQEAIHSQSYSYILDSICNQEEINDVIYQWKNDKHLLERNRYIGELYNKFNACPSRREFIKVLFANYSLEGIYFYSGFMFFYNLQRLNKINGVAQEIRYINRDESTHLALFNEIINNLMIERSELFDEDFKEELRNIIITAVEQEINWGKYILGDKIEGINTKMIEDYITYLGNLRLISVGFKPINDITINPCQWIDDMSDSNLIKSDFFEAKSTAYAKDSFIDDL